MEEFFNLKTIILVLAIIFLIVLLIYSFKTFVKSQIKINPKNKETYKNKEVKKVEKKRSSLKEKTSSVYSKLTQNLEDAMPPNYEGEETNTNQQAQFISQVVEEDFKKNHQTKDTIILSDEDLEKIDEKISQRTGGDISPLIKRVDNEGRIILDFNAINFITKKNVPIITPSGTIRVINFLKESEDILLHLEEKKPLYIIDERGSEKTIKKITPEESKGLFVNLDVFESLSDIENKNRLLYENENEIKNLHKKNLELENNNIVLNEKIKELEIKNTLLIDLTKEAKNSKIIDKSQNEIKVTPIKEATKINETNIISEDLKNDFISVEKNLNNFESNKSKEEKKVEPKPIDLNNNSKELKEEENIKQIVHNKSADLETIEKEEDKSTKKKFNKNQINKTAKTLLTTEYLLSSKILENIEIEIDKLNFVSAITIPGSKFISLFFRTSFLTKYIKDYLENKNFLFTE